MAVTATPYRAFITSLVSNGGLNVSSDEQWICLLKPDYTPNFNDAYYTEITAYELDNDTADGGYKTGGMALPDNTYEQAATGQVVMSAEPALWTALTGTVAYAVIYTPASNTLLGLVDFGGARTYAGDAFQVSFPAGYLSIGAV